MLNNIVIILLSFWYPIDLINNSEEIFCAHVKIDYMEGLDHVFLARDGTQTEGTSGPQSSPIIVIGYIIKWRSYQLENDYSYNKVQYFVMIFFPQKQVI